MQLIKPGPVVAICVPVYDTVKIHFWRSYNALAKPSSASLIFKGGATHTLDQHGFLVEDARRNLTLAALDAEPKVTHVLFVDDDMVFPADALKRLLDHDVPIVGGLCHNRRPPYQPILGKFFPEERAMEDQPHGELFDGERRVGWVYRYPTNTLFEVDMTGGAFLLVKREVFEKIPAPTWWDRIGGKSEDFSFCERARDAGYKILVDTGLEIGHVGEVVVDAAFAKRNRQREWLAWSPEGKLTPGKPVASIVIPTYNQKPRFLKAAILSAAHQTVPVEVIVVDDGSTERVPDEGWPANVRVLHHETDFFCDVAGCKVGGRHRHPQNRGISAALNTGINAMRTEWFCWLSSDDLLDPRKVELQRLALLQSGMKAGFTGWQALVPGEPYTRIAPLPSWRNLEEQRTMLAQVCAINGSTVMIHKDVFQDVGLFDPEYLYGQDWEFWCRVGQKHHWYQTDEILTTRREHGNLTAAINDSAKDDARRLRRDAEDIAIKMRYAVSP